MLHLLRFINIFLLVQKTLCLLPYSLLLLLQIQIQHIHFRLLQFTLVEDSDNTIFRGWNTCIFCHHPLEPDQEESLQNQRKKKKKQVLLLLFCKILFSFGWDWNFVISFLALEFLEKHWQFVKAQTVWPGTVCCQELRHLGLAGMIPAGNKEKRLWLGWICQYCLTCFSDQTNKWHQHPASQSGNFFS